MPDQKTIKFFPAAAVTAKSGRLPPPHGRPAIAAVGVPPPPARFFLSRKGVEDGGRQPSPFQRPIGGLGPAVQNEKF